MSKNNKLSPKLKSNYQDYYHDFDNEWRRLGAIEKAKNIINLCNDLSINSVVEIGAGEGAVIERLSKLYFAQNFYALEISSSGVNHINKKNISLLNECTLFDGYNISYENNSFDLAILSHVIEHVEYPRKLIHEAKRVARYVFIEVPLEDNFRMPRDFVFDKVGHINFYSPKTIRRLVQTCDLKVVNQITTNVSKEVYIYQKGPIGIISFFLKEIFLSCFPRIATELFTYHASLVCKNDDKFNSN